MRDLLQQSINLGKEKILWRRFIVLFFARAIPMFAVIGVTWYFSVKLPIDEYGVYQSCWLNISLLSVIGSFGLPVLFLNKTYLCLFLNDHRTRLTVISILCAAQAASVIYLICIHGLLSPQLLLALIAIIVFQSAVLVYESVYLALERQGLVLTLNVIYALGFAAWHYYVVVTGYSLLQLLYGVCAMNLVKLVCFIFFLKPQLPATATSAIDNKVFLQNWVLLGANEIVSIFSKWIDKIVIFFLLSSADFGYYFNGAYEIPVFGMLVTIAGNILVVSFSKADTAPDNYATQFRSVTMLLSSIVFPAFSFLFFYHKELFTFLFAAKFDNSIPVFLISLFILPIRITYYTAVLQVMHKGNTILYGSLLDIIIFVACSLMLYPFGGLLMIPLSLVLSTAVQASFYLVCTARILKTPIRAFFPVIILFGKLLACFGLTGACYYLLPAVSAGINILAGLAISAILVLILLLRQLKTERLQATTITSS